VHRQSTYGARFEREILAAFRLRLHATALTRVLL